MGAQKLKILVVDDEKDIGDLLISLAADDYQGIYSSSAEDALVKLKEFSSEIVCVISDYKMDGMTGLDLLNAMHKDYKEIPFILVSGFVTREEALAGIEVKSSSFISKPFNNDLMLAQIKRHGSERALLIQERKILEQIFIEESSSIVEDLEPLIMSLEQKPNDMEALNTIFRLVHTIKGSSGVLETTHIRSYVHKYEDLLSKLKTGAMVATPEIVSI
ncbi:MAG: response regulator, partial [Pseudomonadota bacterium]